MRFFTASRGFWWLRWWRSSVERWGLRWRPAVGVDTTARRSESLRTRLVWRVAAAFGGRLKSRAGPPAAPTRRAASLREWGDLLLAGGLFVGRLLLRARALRFPAAVLLVVAFVLDLSSRRLRKRNQTGLVV